MEDISILEFFAVDTGMGAGMGDGMGAGRGAGRGAGWGDGMGAGWGDGMGAGRGAGMGDGWGAGMGDGWGAGKGAGWGSGMGDHAGISSFCGNPVYYIDSTPTLIDKARGSIAKGFILNADLTLSPCFICKGENFFAHGETIHEAMESLRNKLLKALPPERRIELFCLEHEAGVAYPNTNFFEWHHRLTGSCLMGRKAFAEAHGIDLNGEMTVDEFIELTKSSYGGDIIRRLAEKYREN